MFSRKLFETSLIYSRITKRNYQVTVVGGASEIGQTLSLMLRLQPTITKLVIHDTQPHTSGVVLDLSHIPVESHLKGFVGLENLHKSIKDADIIIAAGGLIRKPGISKKTFLSSNTEFIKTLATQIATISPMPFVGIITEPINTLVPMAAEIIRNHGDYNSKKLFGISAIDSLRAQSIYALENKLNPLQCFVPVIGGRSKKTSIPLLSQTRPSCDMDEKSIREFTTKVRNCDEIVSFMKKGCSSTLTTVYSIFTFTQSILEALDGRPNEINAYVENNDFGTSFFSGCVNVDKTGAGEMKRYLNLSQYECLLLEQSIDQLRSDVLKGKKMLQLA